jgi:uncharacterized protein (UPF0261 family)
MSTIAVLGTLDSKGHEHAFVANEIKRHGHTPLLIDVGCLEPPQVVPDIHREMVCPALSALPEDRGQRVAAMAKAVGDFVVQLATDNKIHGIISLGGGGGTAIGTAAMRGLPIGFPKLMVSTLVSGNVAHYVGTKDITMMPSIVDVAGLNRVSRTIFRNAAGAICGMVSAAASAAPTESQHDRPIIVASMFGNTTTCVNDAKALLEAAGFEVLVFHATGTGGRAMEALIESGMVTGVLDITTTEWADELVGATLSAGPTRLDAAAKCGIPAIITPGCLDMANFGEPQTVPAQFAGRNFYYHNPQVTLMRTNAAECTELGKILAEKANASTGPVSVLVPLRGISIIAAEGQPFYDPTADAALFSALKENLRTDIPYQEIDATINDPAFSAACAKELLRLIEVGLTHE